MLNLRGRSPGTSGGRSFSKKIIFTLVTVLVGLGILFWYANQLVVSINPEAGLPKQCFTAQIGEVWNIAFTHSVQLTTVEEFFRVDGIDKLMMTHTRYQSLGVGLPYSPAEGTLIHTSDGKFILKMDRPYKTVTLRTAVQAKPRIVHQGKVYDLCDLYGQGTLVEIRAEKRYQYWFN